MEDLSNKIIAVLVTDGFEESEFTVPVEALENAGASCHVISIKPGRVKAWSDKNWSNEYEVDHVIDEVVAEDYDGLLLPGGVMSPDKLRMNENVVKFISAFFEGEKPIAAICHGPWPLIETGFVRGRKLTSYPSLKTDLTNAGAYWVDEEVVVDKGLVTSRNPGDLPAFCDKMIEEFSEGKH